MDYSFIAEASEVDSKVESVDGLKSFNNASLVLKDLTKADGSVKQFGETVQGVYYFTINLYPCIEEFFFHFLL